MSVKLNLPKYESKRRIVPELSLDQDTRAFYFRLRTGKAATTVEVKDGTVFVDLDAEGKFLGVEVLDLTESEAKTGTRPPASETNEPHDATGLTACGQ